MCVCVCVLINRIVDVFVFEKKQAAGVKNEINSNDVDIMIMARTCTVPLSS